MRAALPSSHPPGAWPRARRLARVVVQPVERFLQVEASSSILLIAAALAALLWANSPWSGAYQWLLRLPLGVVAGPFTFQRPLSFWINDGLMVVFFFVVGLELRREIQGGELREPRRAALPAAAALGGMIAPALIYAALNGGGPGARGWGVPMATDITFAASVLALLGKRVPPSVRVLLLALAILDDLGAIVVIAIFYSSGVAAVGLLIAALGIAGVVALRAIGARRPVAYLVPGLVVWAGLLRAGVSPTLAGIVLGLMTPARPWYGASGFVAVTERAVDELRSGGHGDRELLGPLERVGRARREAVPPLVRLEAALHHWVAYGVVPLFALANAGVDLRGAALGDPGVRRIALGVFVGLLVGKPTGVVAASFLAERAGLALRPAGVRWSDIALVGLTAAIGFTMAIFIADLAFASPRELGAAKLGVLAAAAAGGTLAFAAGHALLPRPGAAERPASARVHPQAPPRG